MRRPHLAVLLAVLVPVPPAQAAGEAAPRADVVSLRFAWPAPARARVVHRRTRLRTGKRPGTFTARYEARVEAKEGEMRLTTRATAWRGDLPYAPAVARDAIRASERVVQRVRADGEFLGLEGAEALRPVLARVLDDARIPPEQAERALAQALAAARLEAEELWNLGVGFWTGADLKVGETYAMQSEGELPLLPGVRSAQAVEFNVRRRVPCAAGERAARCVEAVLRAVPDRAAVDRAAPQLLARLLPPGAEPREGAAADLAAESEILLVTDPATLMPRRLVWTKAVRLEAGDEGPPEAELVDRAEWDWKWLPARAAPAPKATPAARAGPARAAASGSRSRSRTTSR